jgi:hypothetical protein
MQAGRQIRQLRFDNVVGIKLMRGELYEYFPNDPWRLIHLPPERQRVIMPRLTADSCPHCGSGLQQAHRDDYGGVTPGYYSVVTCTSCGMWRALEECSISYGNYVLPYVKGFHPQRHVASLDNLIGEIASDPKGIFALNPKQFELFVGSVMRSAFNCDVRHVGQTRDRGIDLVMIAGDDPIMIQVKRRERQGRVEGVDVVKLLFASMFEAGARKGKVVTTAQRFSRDAKKWIHLPALSEYDYDIELIDIDRLLDMVAACRGPNDPPGWEVALKFWSACSSSSVSRDGARITCGSEHAVVELQDTKDRYLFRADTRDCCWKREPPPDGGSIMGNDGASVNEFQTDLKGTAFWDVLAALPDHCHAALVDLWAKHDNESIYEFIP